jgi:uncharacterized membrane protein YdbT with pleckstrin-like domain
MLVLAVPEKPRTKRKGSRKAKEKHKKKQEKKKTKKRKEEKRERKEREEKEEKKLRKRKRVWESKNKREKRFKTNFIRMFHHATICFPILAIVVTALSPICCIIPPSLRMVRFLCFPHMATRDFAEICVLNEMSKCTMF